MTSRNRIDLRFGELRSEGRAGLITFVTAGDPDRATSQEILRRLPDAGADLIELGIPFSDPMADGPAIQASSMRALRGHQTLQRTLDMVAEFRIADQSTPVVLMGYFNPIYVFGVEKFAEAAALAGVDGLIVVDLPPEEAEELLFPAQAAGLHVIFLAAPTTSDERLPKILRHAGGFLYYVSITGVTGTRSPSVSKVTAAVQRIRRSTDLPIAVGFGINTASQARAIAELADAAVVGSALVTTLAEHLDAAGVVQPGLMNAVLGVVSSLAEAVRQARK